MKLRELIESVDRQKPNQYGETDKTNWVNEIEQIVWDEIISQSEGEIPVLRRYQYDNDADAELLVPDPYCDVYMNYLFAKIDFSNAEFQRYNNDVALYSAAYDSFAGYWIRNHMPKQPASIHGF